MDFAKATVSELEAAFDAVGSGSYSIYTDSDDLPVTTLSVGVAYYQN